MTEPTPPKSYDQLMKDFETWKDMEDRAAAANAEPIKHKRRFRPSWRKVGLIWSALVNITSLLLFITAGVLALIGDLTVEALFFGLVGLFNMSQWGRDGQRRR